MKGVEVIPLRRFEDERGWFVELGVRACIGLGEHLPERGAELAAGARDQDASR